MDKLWQELFGVLADILSAYRKMLELGHAKRDALVGAKVKEIEDITKQEETLIIFVTQSEKVRKSIVEKIAVQYKLPPEEVNLARLKSLTDTETAKKLEKFDNDFHKVLVEFEPLNKTNNELIQQALGIVNYNINLMTQNVAESNYAPNRQGGQTNPNRAIFDRKV